MNFRFVSLAVLLALGLVGYAHTGFAKDVSSLAGVYSSAHPITVNGVKVQTNGYIEIDHTGRITAFEQQGEGPASIGSGCYLLAAGSATNAGLQGRILTLGVSPRGETAYQTLAGDYDTFGILAEPASSGSMRWFFHWGPKNSTVTINGSRNVVNSSNDASYSISGPALASPTPDQLRSMICHADNGPEAVVAGRAVAGRAQEASKPSERDVKAAKLLQDGSLLAASRKPTEAIEDFDKVIAIYEEAYRDEKAKLYSARSMPEGLLYMLEASKANTPAKVVSGNWAYAYYTKAYALVELRQLPEAKTSLQRAIELAPHNSQFLSELGGIYQIEKNWPNAMKTFLAAEKQTEFSPPELKNAELSRAWRGQAYVYVEQNQLDEAEKLYRKCLELNASDKKALNELRFIQAQRAKQNH